MLDFRKNIKAYLKTLSKTIAELNIDELNNAMNAIARAYENNSNIYIFGNGGSAATASHFVCDFNKGISLEKEKKFNLICLNDNMPVLTAIANDIGYEDVFLFQMYSKLEEGDLVIAISGSGNSLNIIKAVKYAKECGATVLGISGYSGGSLRKLSDYSMHVNIDDMQITEDIHMVFDHMMMKILSENLK